MTWNAFDKRLKDVYQDLNRDRWWW